MHPHTPTYRFPSHDFLVVLIFCLAAFSSRVRSQTPVAESIALDSLSRYVGMKYGLDQSLINGYQYYQRYVMFKGDPYFQGNSFRNGSVSMRGEEYGDLHLKYDIYSQHLELEYTDFQNRYNQLIIDSIHIDSFRMGGYPFRKMAMPDEMPQFYQVVESGPVTGYIHWSKIATTVSGDLQYSHQFSDPVTTCFLGYGGEIHAFSNSKSFTALFPESLQPDLRKYIRKNRISFRTADPENIEQLLQYVAQLLETSPAP